MIPKIGSKFWARHPWWEPMDRDLLNMRNESRLTAEDMAWIYNATVEALNQVKDIHRKTTESIDGEVFTSLRRMARDCCVSPTIRQIFTGKMKTLSMRVESRTATREQEVLVHMYKTLRNARMSEEPDSMAELELSLLVMQANLKKAKEIADTAETVRRNLETVPKILEGEEK